MNYILAIVFRSRHPVDGCRLTPLLYEFKNDKQNALSRQMSELDNNVGLAPVQAVFAITSLILESEEI